MNNILLSDKLPCPTAAVQRMHFFFKYNYNITTISELFAEVISFHVFRLVLTIKEIFFKYGENCPSTRTLLESIKNFNSYFDSVIYCSFTLF